jgi:NAD+ kinase
MGVVGLVVHHGRPEALRLAAEVAAWLRVEGHEVRLSQDDATLTGLEVLSSEEDGWAEGMDVAVSLGGDGTILRTVDRVALRDVPVIGVNFGQLGYLTEVEPSGLRHALHQFFSGAYELEERMMLRVRVDAPSGGLDLDHADALNEAVLEKTLSGHTVRLSVSIDGRYFTTYATDGLIVATPTGSTAYAFSARGPIVAPTHRALLLTPVSPHMLFDRTLVLEPSSELSVTVEGHRAASLAVDGRVAGQLAPGDRIVCTASPHRARLVMFTPRDFHRILKTKFGLADR